MFLLKSLSNKKFWQKYVCVCRKRLVKTLKRCKFLNYINLTNDFFFNMLRSFIYIFTIYFEPRIVQIYIKKSRFAKPII